ncbi:MAG: hypothetical protein AABY22_02840 [Nanoarchaeota archaeon]
MVIKEEKDNFLDILENVKQAISDENVVLLRELSDRTIHTASTVQDTDSILLAVIIYSLSKIIERKQYRELKGWNKFFSIFTLEIDRAINFLKKNNQKEFVRSLERIRGSINSISGDLRSYIEDVFRKAQINKASKIYEHGISLETTAKLLGITIWELAGYTGQKDAADGKFFYTESAKTRIKQAMEMFE